MRQTDGWTGRQDAAPCKLAFCLQLETGCSASASDMSARVAKGLFKSIDRHQKPVSSMETDMAGILSQLKIDWWYNLVASYIE